MAERIVRPGSDRLEGEGLRIGTDRRPPRGVPTEDFARLNYYDLWLPELAPSVACMKLGKDAEGEKDWARFERKYRAEMSRPGALRLLDLLAALSRQTDFAVGCYCEDGNRCHRSVLKRLLAAMGALVK